MCLLSGWSTCTPVLWPGEDLVPGDYCPFSLGSLTVAHGTDLEPTCSRAEPMGAQAAVVASA